MYMSLCHVLKLLRLTTRVHIEVRHLAHLYKGYTLIANLIYKLATYLVNLPADSYATFEPCGKLVSKVAPLKLKSLIVDFEVGSQICKGTSVYS